MSKYWPKISRTGLLVMTKSFEFKIFLRKHKIHEEFLDTDLEAEKLKLKTKI